MGKVFKRQVLIGILGMLTSGISGWFFIAYFTDTIPSLARIIVVGIIGSLFIGFIFFIFGGWKSFLLGAGMFTLIPITAIVIESVPQPYVGIFAAVILALIFIIPIVKGYRAERNKYIHRTKSSRQKRKEQEEMMLEKQLLNEEEQFKSSIGFGEKSLLLLQGKSSSLYQMIKTENGYALIKVGGELSGVDESALVTDFNKIEKALAHNKKNMEVLKSEMLKIEYEYGGGKESLFPISGSIKIYTAKWKRRYSILDNVSKEQIRHFFEGVQDFTLKKVKTSYIHEEDQRVSGQEEAALVIKLKTIAILLTVLGVAASAVFLFIPVNYTVMSTICMLIPAIAFALYIKYDEYLSMAESKSGESMFKGKRIDITLAILLPSCALGLRSLLDINMHKYKEFIIWSIALATVIAFLFFFYSKEYKKRKSAIIGIILMIVIYAPSSIAQINYAYPPRAVDTYKSAVSDMHIDTSSKGGNIYYFTIKLKEGNDKDIQVSKGLYDEVSVGSVVSVYEYIGILEIPFVEVKEVRDN